MVNQVLVEESIIGWKELELEIIRDSNGNKITVCFIENIDPMGIHTGDSICCVPMLTIPKKIQKRLQGVSYKIIDAIRVIGGTNVQLAYKDMDNRIIIIEINPRTSRSSALASKATGFPITFISTKLALRYTLNELKCYQGKTL